MYNVSSPDGQLIYNMEQTLFQANKHRSAQLDKFPFTTLFRIYAVEDNSMLLNTLPGRGMGNSNYQRNMPNVCKFWYMDYVWTQYNYYII